MATIETQEWYPHAGAMWARLIDLFTECVLDDTKTFGYDFYTVSSYRAEVPIINVGGDSYHYVLIDMGMLSADKYSWDHFWTLPGIKKTPPVLPKLAGSRNTLDYWNTKIPNIRSDFVARALGNTYTMLDVPDYTYANPPTRIVGAVWACKKTLHYNVDMVLATAESDAGTAGYAGSTPDVNGAPALSPAQIVSSGGGGSVDLDPLVTAVNDLCRRDVQTSIDNGAITVLQYSGDIVEP